MENVERKEEYQRIYEKLRRAETGSQNIRDNKMNGLVPRIQKQRSRGSNGDDDE